MPRGSPASALPSVAPLLRRRLLLVPLIVGGTELLGWLAAQGLPHTWSLQLAQDITTALGLTFAIWLAVVRPMIEIVETERAATREREESLVAEGQRQLLEAQVGRALDFAESEEEVFKVVSKSLGLILPYRAVELLLADSGDAHLRRVVEVGPEGVGPRCPVDAPNRCHASRRGQSLLFPDSETIDACPQIAARDCGRCAAVCVPVSVVGKVVGVLHMTTETEWPPTPPEVARLEMLANLSGTRLGIVRVVASMQVQATTDPLTGLLNRRSFETRARALLATHRPFSLVMADLDHFKRLNDTYGHEAGDRALKVFAATVRSTLRGGDIIGRMGGEEFIFILPECAGMHALRAIEKLREALAMTTGRGAVPAFTASFGVVESSAAENLDALTSIADRALYRAKHQGRDRAELAGHASDEGEPVSELVVQAS